MNDQTIKEFDAIIVGAGFAGIYQLLKLRRLGLSAVILEKADQIGGTWHWNRYPGARCDIPSLEFLISSMKICNRSGTGQKSILLNLKF